MVQSEPQWFPLDEAPPHFQSRPHVGTVIRWARKGVLVGGSGVRVKLGTQKIGGRFTNRELIAEFVARTNDMPAQAAKLSQQRAEAIAAYRRDLIDDGF